MDEEQQLGFPLILKSNLTKIRDYLQNYYRTMTDVSVSPVGERNVSVSEVYVSSELEGIEGIETRDTEDSNIDLTCATQCNILVSDEDTVNVMTQNKLFLPVIMIVGDQGSGKSTLCKHLVSCWSHNSIMGDTEMQGLNLSPLISFQILLYLPLKHSDQGLSFQALLQRSLFPTQLSYLEFVRSHMNGQNLSQSILIIIDGLDKISKNDSLELISEFLVSKLVSSCTFIFTSRPGSFNQISDACIDRAMKLYKIREMTLEKSTTYLNKVLIVINQQNNTQLNPDNFLTFTKYLHVECLLTSPYYCLSLLHVWMENKNPHIQMKDILFNIVENLLNHVIYSKSCKQKICKVLEGIMSRLLHRPSCIKKFVDSVSIIADEIFQSGMKTLTEPGVEGLCHENLTRGSNMSEVASELGLITESPSLVSKEGISKLTFTNILFYNFWVSNAVALKKGPTFDYLVSRLDVALENSLIIHMLCQFSPARGKEIFSTISKQKNKNIERHDELNTKYLIKHTNERHSPKGKEVPVWWLQNLMYKSKLDDRILLFVTDALRFTDSLSVLELKNLDNNEDLIFWLPFSKTLIKLMLNISNCTLLLCPEWKYEESINLKEVIIESMSIDENTRCVLAKAFGTCRHLTKWELPPVTITNINEILLPRSDHTTNS